MPPGNSRIGMRFVVNLQNQNDQPVIAVTERTSLTSYLPPPTEVAFPTCLQPEVLTMKIASGVLKVLSLLTALAASGRSHGVTPSTAPTLQAMPASTPAPAP